MKDTSVVLHLFRSEIRGVFTAGRPTLKLTPNQRTSREKQLGAQRDMSLLDRLNSHVFAPGAGKGCREELVRFLLPEGLLLRIGVHDLTIMPFRRTFQ